MGVGKTTLGAAVAVRLDRPFLDSDGEIESKYGRTGAEIAAQDGVPALHEIELEVFVDMAGSVEPAVIASAASVVDSSEGRRLIDEHFTIWVEVPPHVADDRRATGAHRRPMDTEEQRRRDESRSGWLEDLADMEVDNTRPLEIVVENVIAGITRRLAI